MRLETEFFPQNLVSFYHNSAGCAVRALQIVLFKQVLKTKTGLFLDPSKSLK